MARSEPGIDRGAAHILRLRQRIGMDRDEQVGSGGAARSGHARRAARSGPRRASSSRDSARWPPSCSFRPSPKASTTDFSATAGDNGAGVDAAMARVDHHELAGIAAAACAGMATAARSPGETRVFAAAWNSGPRLPASARPPTRRNRHADCASRRGDDGRLREIEDDLGFFGVNRPRRKALTKPTLFLVGRSGWTWKLTEGNSMMARSGAA